MVKVALSFKSLGVEKNEHFFKGTGNCQNVEIRKSGYY